MRNSLLSYLAIFFAVAIFSLDMQSTGYAAGGTSPDGLELTEFSVVTRSTTPKVGDTVHVIFKLKNVTSGLIQLSPNYGVFVGARWNSTTDANNRDFGHKFKGKVVQPGVMFSFTASRKLDAAGTWRFWPAYNVNGHWGPFRWNEAVINVSEGLR